MRTPVYSRADLYGKHRSFFCRCVWPALVVRGRIGREEANVHSEAYGDSTIRLNLMADVSGHGASSALPGEKSAVREAGDAGRYGTGTVIVCDPSGRVQEGSAAAVTALGYAQDEFSALHVWDLVAHLDAAVLDVLVHSAVPGRRMVLDALCRRKNGTVFPAEIDVTVLTKPDAGGYLTLHIHEVGHRKSGEDAPGLVEARIARAERLEMAGTVAGQIAHDFNNLLTPLLAYPELIRRELTGNPTVEEYLSIIEKTASDMSHLTQQLLSLSRRGQVGTDVFNLNDVAEEVITLLQTVVPDGVTIEFDFAENLLPVKGGRDQVHRMMQNLCQNAVDAMGEKGELCIKTENVYLDAPVGQYDSVKVGEYVKLSIIDSGSGIADEIKDRIFDPFFTTKRASKQRGSGLGLSIVHGIIKDHSGYIDLESVVGRGTTFYVFLPIHRGKVPSQAGDRLPRGRERVLVVDDDAPQVQVVVSLLDTLGYQAVGVQSGEEALRRIRAGERFDLVILDMIMESGMDGLDTFRAIRECVPGQKVILISGFSRSARDVQQAQQAGAGTYLRKPLTIERVAKTVRLELDGTLEAREGGHPQKRILIVDDEHMIRKLFGMIISAEIPEAVIDQAENGVEAVRKFRERPHDLIIMDLQMPMCGGRETFAEIARLCEVQRWKAPPVIFCTGFTPPASLNEIIGDGQIHCLLRKPVRADTLLQAVRNRL
jgi:PAS domain S-box-containing protein